MFTNWLAAQSQTAWCRIFENEDTDTFSIPELIKKKFSYSKFYQENPDSRKWVKYMCRNGMVF